MGGGWGGGGRDGGGAGERPAGSVEAARRVGIAGALRAGELRPGLAWPWGRGGVVLGAQPPCRARAFGVWPSSQPEVLKSFFE